MPDDFGLLFQPISVELPPRLQAIIIAAKRMPPKWQAYAFLVLPHMHEFVDEQALRAEASIAKIIAEYIALWVKPYMAVRGHRHAARLKPKISAVMDADIFIFER